MTTPPAPPREDWVVCLCAGWCGVCREWQPQFQALATAHPGWRFAWVDVEDEDEFMGEVDIQTFPTLLVVRDGRAVFLGPAAPTASGLGLLLVRDGLPQPLEEAVAHSLFQRLRAHVLDRPLS